MEWLQSEVFLQGSRQDCSKNPLAIFRGIEPIKPLCTSMNETDESCTFAGVRGGILASELHGETFVCAVEIDPYCRSALARPTARWNPASIRPIWDDVRTFDGKPFETRHAGQDVVAGGHPCLGWPAKFQGARAGHTEGSKGSR